MRPATRAPTSSTGNAGDNILIGRGGNDTLDGGGENDTLKGGAGNDTYFVDSTDDQVFEEVGKGKDTVFAAGRATSWPPARRSRS